jgi:Fe-S-cluster-containing dehydrogenase component
VLASVQYRAITSSCVSAAMDEKEAEVTSPTAPATTYVKTRKQGKKTPARHRHRATAACLHCRKARIRVSCPQPIAGPKKHTD